MSIELTKVFDLSKNVFIEACAGAGKTWLLSKRYAAIIDDFARQHAENPSSIKDASNILVITFTRKAAAEMSSRIYSDLNQLLNDQSLDFTPPGFGANLRGAADSYKLHLRANYARNAISTIDSFCTQILREQAENLDIDPEFRIQDEADTQRMILETWERFLREKSQAHDEDLSFLLDHLSVYHLNEYIKKLQSHSELLFDWLAHHAEHDPDVLMAEFKGNHPLPPGSDAIEALLEALVHDLPLPAEMLDASHAQYQLFQAVQMALGSGQEADYLHKLKLFELVQKLALTSTGEKYLSRFVVSPKVWPAPWIEVIRGRLKSFVAQVESILPLEQLTTGIPRPADLIACSLQHHLSRFFLSYQEAIKQRLKRENVLSFDEVIVKTHGLLQKPEIAAIYGQRFSHILFDEFQDTNDLRWDIVRLIAEKGEHKLRDRGLFIVGDAKQSIYRFNQADVQVMNRVRRLIQDGGGLILHADETYRSSRSYVEAVINPLVGQAFPGPHEKDQLELYETYFTPTEAAEHSPLSHEQHALARATVNVVLSTGDTAGPSPDITRVARLAEEWLNWLNRRQIGSEEKPQVGILLRTFTHIMDYIRVFTQVGLPFEVLSSKGLFAQQEAYDIYHFLSVLNNPLDDLALVGLLRSPFIVLADRDIQELRETNTGQLITGWCWQALRVVRPEIQETIRSWQKAAAREPLDRLLTGIIGSDERQLGWISETGGLLRLENILKLIHTIHSLSLDGLSQREILEYFKYQIQHGDASQAELPGSAKIQILSIHKSKGLEFPVVILPELHSTPKPETSGLYMSPLEGEWQVGLSVDIWEETQKTWMYDQIKSRSHAEELAEDRRLFYVALTRAQFGVSFVLKVNPGKKPDSRSWWERYLQPVLDLPLDKTELQEDPEALANSWKESSTEIFEFELNPTVPAIDQSGNTQGKAVGFDEVEPLSPSLGYEEISPHTLMTWVDSRKSLGAEERKKGEDLGLETSALTFGRLLHRVMEMAWFDPEQYRPEILHFLMEEGVMEEALQAEFLQDLDACLKIYQQSSLATELEEVPQAKKLAEMPIFGYLRNEKMVYKVSGIIDLLYWDGQQWIVLDYKTDRELPANPEKKDYAYWFQVQTYLWMLKQLYGIEAKGVLYFNRFDSRIEIENEEALYFSKISELPQTRGLTPFLPNNSAPADPLLEVVKRLDHDHQTILLEPTRDSCERLAQSLASHRLHFPLLQIRTLSEVRKSLEHSKRRLTPYLARLGVASMLGKNRQWGIVNRLAEAFYKATQGEQVVSEKAGMYQQFLAWCDDRELVAEISAWDVSSLGKDTRMIVNGISSTSPADYRFLNTLSRELDTIFLNPLRQGKPESGFNMGVGHWSVHSSMPLEPSRHPIRTCYGVQGEVEMVAEQITQLLESGVPATSIQIAVSSMERYVPTIVRIFGEQELPFRLSKREPVMERPVTQLAFALLQGAMSYRLSWDLAMAVWLHPLAVRGGVDLAARQRLDLEVRKLGITQLDDSLVERFQHLENSLGESLVSSAKDLLRFVGEDWQVVQEYDLKQSAQWLLDLLKGFDFTLQLEPGSVAAKAYTSLKNAIEGVRADWGSYLSSKGSLADLNRELRERLKGVEVASTRQGFGLEVISFLDTLNQHAPYLFVMGLSEGQFPVAPDSNPFLKQSQLNPWFLNLNLFKTWLRYPEGHLFFSASERDAGGEALELSTFCQYLSKAGPPKIRVRSLRQQYEKVAGKILHQANSPRQIRHNELQQSPGAGQFFGQLQPPAEKPNIYLSASAFDDLIKCPQRYWYARKLKLEPAETDIAQRDEVELGNLVHKVLEHFGKAGGFLTAGQDLEQAYLQLERSAGEVLKLAQVDLSSDLLDSKGGEVYFTNFHDPSRNLLSAMLQLEQDTLTHFPSAGLHEQSFGKSDDPDSWPLHDISNDDISLNLLGQIDRVFFNASHVWASDYKTGAVDLKQSREFWTSQMFFYYMVLKSKFPELDVVLTYEQLKSFRNAQFGFNGYLGDTESDHPLLTTLPSRGNVTIPIAAGADWNLERIEKETLNYARFLAAGNFPLTDRDESKACAYCQFERICRKTALPR
jgi:ATP-dependent exoDNAse (exonuclease V) beta subunit